MARAIGTLALLLPVAGVLALLLDKAMLGVVLLLAWAGCLFVFHLILGIGSYRHVMRRPWPTVPPLEDEDDDW